MAWWDVQLPSNADIAADLLQQLFCISSPAVFIGLYDAIPLNNIIFVFLFLYPIFTVVWLGGFL